ncbi:putative UDP-glucuronosyl/UDP-glucosyltransferase [Helianthus anomalus]
MGAKLIDELRSIFPHIYSIGPLQLPLNQITQEETKNSSLDNYSLWKEESERVQWLHDKEPNSLVYMDLVDGKTTVLPEELEEVIRKRDFVASWCPQEEVINHHSVGGFLTHGRSGSIIESLPAWVPMICWPGTNDQRVNCIQMCKELEVAMATSLKGYGLKSCADQMS